MGGLLISRPRSCLLGRPDNIHIWIAMLTTLAWRDRIRGRLPEVTRSHLVCSRYPVLAQIRIAVLVSIVLLVLANQEPPPARA
jgi:hypothetical protein